MEKDKKSTENKGKCVQKIIDKTSNEHINIKSIKLIQQMKTKTQCNSKNTVNANTYKTK